MTIKPEILAGVKNIPTLPVVATRLTRLLKDTDVEVSTLVEVVQYDPSMTAGIIKLANSAKFGAGREISTLKEALVRLGFDELYRHVVVNAVGPVLNRPVETYDLAAGQLWRHCVATAIGAETIEEMLGGKGREGLAFTAGLLHDVGKLVFGSLDDQYFRQIDLKVEDKDTPFDEAEREVLGMDHTEAGAMVLEHWGFPADMVEVVRRHHQPELAVINPRLADLVHVADLVSLMMGVGIGRDQLGYRASGEAMTRLGMNRQMLEMAAYRMIQKLEEVETKFTVGAA